MVSDAKPVPEACAGLQSSLVKSSEVMRSGITALAEDPASAIAIFDAFAVEFGAARQSIDDADVTAKTDAAGSALDHMIASIHLIIDDPDSFDQDAFSDQTIAYQDSFLAIGELCA